MALCANEKETGGKHEAFIINCNLEYLVMLTVCGLQEGDHTPHNRKSPIHNCMSQLAVSIRYKR
jgi:hypothetical protein